jgi:sec-independent protein translocase protein TatC
MSEATNLRRRRLRFRRRKQKPNVATMTMIEHLRELRTRIMISAFAFVVAAAVAFTFYEPIFEFFRQPLCDVPPEFLGVNKCNLTVTKVTEPFLFRLKLTALVGIALASPVWLYQLYAFVVPALTPKEKSYTWPFIIASVTLFLVGAAFAYIAMPTGITFLLRVGGTDLEPLLRAEEYLNFIGLMLLGFGAMFELPLLLFFLGLANIVSVEQLQRQRRVAIVVIVALAALVTPSQDPFTLLLLSVPLYLLYELTIVLLKIIKRRREITD